MRSWALASAILILAAGCTTPAGGPELVSNPVAPCGELETVFEPDPAYNPRVTLETSNGTVELSVYLNQVPFTAGNFLQLVQEGFYDGTRFHQIRPGQFLQGGDPHSASQNKNFWGTGGPGYTIRDEFHQFLRHDGPGVVAMASDKPHGAGSQFTIHLSPAYGLDDRTAVFAEVIEGMDVVERLAQTPTDDRGRPLFEGRLIDATVVAPERSRSSANVTLSAYGYDCVQAAEPGGTAEFLLSARNTGQRVLNGTFEMETPEGWSATVRNADKLVLPSGQTSAYIIDVDVPPDAEMGTSENVTLSLVDPDSEERLDQKLQVNVGELGPVPAAGDRLQVHFLGMLEDGRPFDTTHEVYTQERSLTWFHPPPTDSLSPLPFRLTESGLELDFEELPPGASRAFPVLEPSVNRTALGATAIQGVDPGEAYSADSWGRTGLGGRILLFQVQIVSLEEA